MGKKGRFKRLKFGNFIIMIKTHLQGKTTAHVRRSEVGLGWFGGLVQGTFEK